MKYNRKRIEKYVLNIKWLKAKLIYWAEQEKDNEHFCDFDCSDFFRGEKLAKLNREIYRKRRGKINRKYNQIERFLDSLKEK